MPVVNRPEKCESVRLERLGHDDCHEKNENVFAHGPFVDIKKPGGSLHHRVLDTDTYSYFPPFFPIARLETNSEGEFLD